MPKDDLPQKIVIAVCGSYGKTTMKEILATVLSQKYQVLASQGNENTPLGISKLVQKLTSQTEVLLLEFGEFVRGDIKGLCQLFPPDIGIITGINQQHSQRMGGLANAIECMFEIADFAKTLVLNADDANIVDNWQKFQKNSTSNSETSEEKLTQKVLFYSANNHQLSNFESRAHFDKTTLSWQAEILAKEQNQAKSLEFINQNQIQSEVSNGKIFSEKGDLLENDYSDSADQLEVHTVSKTSFVNSKLTINLLGKYAVGNVLAATLIASELNLSPKQLQMGLAQIKPVKHRLEPIWNEQTGVLVIDDSYNGNPDGVMAAIEVLASLKN